MLKPLHETAPHSARPIKSLADAQAWIRDLDAAGCLFHFEDHPADLIVNGGRPLWSAEAAELVTQRLEEAWAHFNAHNLCPFEWSRPLWGMDGDIEE